MRQAWKNTTDCIILSFKGAISFTYLLSEVIYKGRNAKVKLQNKKRRQLTKCGLVVTSFSGKIVVWSFNLWLMCRRSFYSWCDVRLTLLITLRYWWSYYTSCEYWMNWYVSLDSGKQEYSDRNLSQCRWSSHMYWEVI